MTKTKIEEGTKIKWRGRLGYFVKKTQPHKAQIRLVGNKSKYRVSIHELRIVYEAKVPVCKPVANDPLQILIVSGL